MTNNKVTKLAKFTSEAESLLNQLDCLFSNAMVNDGDTTETSQRMALLNALNQVESCVNGVIQSDILDAYEMFADEKSMTAEDSKFLLSDVYGYLFEDTHVICTNFVKAFPDAFIDKAKGEILLNDKIKIVINPVNNGGDYE